MPGLGDEFRAAREARNLSLGDVSDCIHIRSVYLQSIEDEDWSSIAAPVYVRGFVRTYARFLGLDAEAAVARANATLDDEFVTPYEPVALAAGRRRLSPWLLLAAAVATSLVAFVTYSYLRLQHDDRLASTASVVTVVTAAPRGRPLRTAALPADGVLDVRFTQTAWLRVTVDGTRALLGVFPAGTHKTFRGKVATVRTGNAGAIELTLNGKNLGPLGAAGTTVDRPVFLSGE